MRTTNINKRKARLKTENAALEVYGKPKKYEIKI